VAVQIMGAQACAQRHQPSISANSLDKKPRYTSRLTPIDPYLLFDLSTPVDY
jgi:hypothetical protein